jgi:ribosomal protein S18 acetylase RimI-like enzyme
MTTIRRYRPTDFDDVTRVCLLTAAGGGDATGQHVSDDLMPDIFVRPYVLFEPDWAWVVDDGAASGYIIGTPDTRAFVARYRAKWVPAFAEKYVHVDPPVTHDEVIRHLGFVPERMLIPEVDEYPAHLHIDLLPHLQGQGLGRQLIGTLVDALRSAGVPGLHLSMNPENTGARAFYDRLGFEELPSSRADAPVLGMRL